MIGTIWFISVSAATTLCLDIEDAQQMFDDWIIHIDENNYKFIKHVSFSMGEFCLKHEIENPLTINKMMILKNENTV